VKELVNDIYNFLATHDFPTVLEAFRKLEWSQVIRSGYTWFIVLPILIFLLWTKKFKTIVALVSFFLFLVLVQKTLSPPGGTLSLHDLFIFLSGAVVLVGINLYLIFVRE
jgi:hypothetical protein